jgi:hypothetical protein
MQAKPSIGPARYRKHVLKASIGSVLLLATLSSGEHSKYHDSFYVATGTWNLVSCKKKGFDCPATDLNAARQSMLYARDNPDDRADRITAIVEIMCIKDSRLCVLAVPTVPWTEEALAGVYVDWFNIRKWDDRGIDADSLGPVTDQDCLRSHPTAKVGSELHITFSGEVDSVLEKDYIAAVSCPPEERVFQLADDEDHRHKHTFVGSKLGVRTH